MSIPTHHIIPENEPPCIWMDAGVVAYKLCTFDFRCETCPFDAQIRAENRSAQSASGMPPQAPARASAASERAGAGSASAENRNAVTPPVQAPRAAEVSGGAPKRSAPASSVAAESLCASMLEQVLRSVDTQKLPDDRMYASNHTWAKQEGDGSYVLGVDHFIGTMLSGMHSVACSIVPTHIKASEPFAWIVANGETLALRSPIAGTIVANNPSLGDRSSMIHRDPYGGGWISRIIPPRAEGTRELMTAERFAPALERDAAKFEKSIRARLRGMGIPSGPTMYDGGAALSNFEDVLGSARYFTILEKFLRPRR